VVAGFRGDADERPFGLDFIEAAQQELVEAARLFDLPEHRFDDPFAKAVVVTPTGTAR
jgi:hypothetical protein